MANAFCKTYKWTRKEGWGWPGGVFDPQAGIAEISRMYLPNAADQSKYTDSISEDFSRVQKYLGKGCLFVFLNLWFNN